MDLIVVKDTVKAREARQALGHATEMVELARGKVPGGPGDLGK